MGCAGSPRVVGTLKRGWGPEQRPGPPWGSGASQRHQILTEAAEELKITLPPKVLTQILPAPKLGWTQSPSQHTAGAESGPFPSSRLLCPPDTSYIAYILCK